MGIDLPPNSKPDHQFLRAIIEEQRQTNAKLDTIIAELRAQAKLLEPQPAPKTPALVESRQTKKKSSSRK